MILLCRFEADGLHCRWLSAGQCQPMKLAINSVIGACPATARLNLRHGASGAEDRIMNAVAAYGTYSTR